MINDPLSPAVTSHADKQDHLTDGGQVASDTPPSPASDSGLTTVNLSLVDAARFLGVSDRTIRRRAEKGNLPDGWRVAEGVTPMTLFVTVDSDTLNVMNDTLGQPSALSGATGQVSGLSDAALHLRAERDALERRADELTVEIARLNAEIERLGSRLADADRRERSFEEQATNQRVRIVQLEASEASLTRSVTDAGQLIDWLKSRIEEGEREREGLLALMPKALPEGRPGFWGRFFGRGEKVPAAHEIGEGRS